MQKRIVILGAGESGTGAALLANANGYDVFVSDYGEINENFKKELFEAGITFEERTHTVSRIIDASLIIKSPGISEDTSIMKDVRQQNVQLVSEIEFAAGYTNAKFVAITGTNGKTTTTLLTWHLLKNCGFNAGLAGNVGQSLARQILMDGKDGKDFYVIELSSFQLDDLFSFRPHIAILLNITPDHLDRYENDFSKYRDSKFRILQNMTVDDSFIFWKDDPVILEKMNSSEIIPRKLTVSLTDSNASAYYEEEYLNVLDSRYELNSMPLKGRHNYINMMASISAALLLGAKHGEINSAMQSYRNAPHRMEFIGEVDGITFINDSKATNIDSVYYALEAYDSSITWIAGGVDKGNDYNKLKTLVTDKVKALICLGTDNQKLKKAFGGVLNTILETQDIKEAARMGYEYSQNNDVVLLSPACASFDLFRNYEDRGEQFRDAVIELAEELRAKTN